MDGTKRRGALQITPKDDDGSVFIESDDAIVEDGFIYDADGVEINNDGSILAVYGFSSKRKGGGRAFFKFARSLFAHISIHGIGDLDHPTGSEAFWLAMFDEGLVDTLEDDEGKTVRRRA